MALWEFGIASENQNLPTLRKVTFVHYTYSLRPHWLTSNIKTIWPILVGLEAMHIRRSLPLIFKDSQNQESSNGGIPSTSMQGDYTWYSKCKSCPFTPTPHELSKGSNKACLLRSKTDAMNPAPSPYRTGCSPTSKETNAHHLQRRRH